MMRPLAALAALALFALGGCSSAPRLFTSDGRPTQSIACGAPNSWNDCFAQADSLCQGAGYDVVSRSEGDATRSVLIACRRPPQ
jgi:hypothetical protein